MNNKIPSSDKARNKKQKHVISDLRDQTTQNLPIFSNLVMFVSSVRSWFHYDPILIEPMVINVDFEIMTSESKGTFRLWRGLQLAPRPTLDVFLLSGKSRQEIL